MQNRAVAMTVQGKPSRESGACTSAAAVLEPQESRGGECGCQEGTRCADTDRTYTPTGITTAREREPRGQYDRECNQTS